jgi:hypothetical protein
LTARAILLSSGLNKTGAIYPTATIPASRTAVFALILRWSTPPDKPDATADRCERGLLQMNGDGAGFDCFYHD